MAGDGALGWASGIVGFAWLVFARVSEIPYGYQWVAYETLQPDPAKPTEPIPQTALDMQDRKVFIKGFMQPRRQQTGIKDFILCPTNGECPFCTPNPKRTEMIRVILQGDLETSYTTHPIGVAGRFRVDLDAPAGFPTAWMPSMSVKAEVEGGGRKIRNHLSPIRPPPSALFCFPSEGREFPG